MKYRKYYKFHFLRGGFMRFSTMVCILAAATMFMVGCGPRKGETPTMTVLLRMMPAQERFLREEILPEFERENNCKINIATFDNEWDIERLLKLESGKKNPEICVVKTPFEMTRVLASKGLMEDLRKIKDSAIVMQNMAEYHQLASGLGYVNSVPYYLPRKLETRVLFYRKSMVNDAVSKFETHKHRINKELNSLNGFGLPAGYTLEENPRDWDFYDLYTVGSIWANEEYNGVKMARMAHRGAKYGGTALFLMDRALQLGATKDEILDLTSDKCAETFLWENVLVKKGIYNFSMWQDKWKGSDIYNGIKDGKVFLAYLQQIDLFNVHGWEDDPGMPGYMADPEDMGFVVVPKALSFALDKNGHPLYEGSREISTGGWWWGIPETSPHKELAYSFIRFMTSKEIQAKESSKFGMIPVRKDILMNLPNVFEEGWVGDIFKVSVEQIKINELTTVPLIRQYSQLAQLYVDAWYTLSVEYDAQEEGAMDLSTMKMRLASDFADRQDKLLGKGQVK
ncbi:MAG: extracellular solute-binding protein [Chitinivibrionales bacterium]|nr:extracellular solute-binding protein [Chitinivibrionales bacterium]